MREVDMTYGRPVTADARKRRAGSRGPYARFARKWMWLFHRTRRILRPLDLMVLVVTHILFVGAEEALAYAGMRLWGTFPRRVDPPTWRGTRGTVVLAPGLQQTAFSCYPFGWFLAHAFGFRVLFLQTHLNGNHDTFEEIVTRNRWIIEETGNEPLVGIGFSKGGQDLAWLFCTMMMNDAKRRLGVVMLSTPLRGSKMASVLRSRVASTLLPASAEIRQTLTLVHALHMGGVSLKFFCGRWDRIVRRSDSRPENTESYRPTNPLEWLRGIRRTEPWYWSETLWFQLGHNAIYNPLAWIQVGRHVARCDVYRTPS